MGFPPPLVRFEGHTRNTKDQDLSVIHVNGNNNLGEFRKTGQSWQARPMEEGFERRMADAQQVWETPPC